MRATTLPDAERLAGHAGGDDVGVVAAAAGREGLGVGDAGLHQGVAVEADPDDGAAAEVRVRACGTPRGPCRRQRPNGPACPWSAPGRNRLGRSRGSRCARPERYTRPMGLRTVRSIHPRGNLLRRVQAGAVRPRAAHQPAGRDAAAQAHRAAGLRLRRAVVQRLRHAGDPAGAVAGRVRAVPVRARGWRPRSSSSSWSWSLSYRQNVHAYPSGGGDYEVVSTNLGPTLGGLRRQRADGRLRAHGGGVDLLGRGQRRLGDPLDGPAQRARSRSG